MPVILPVEEGIDLNRLKALFPNGRRAVDNPRVFGAEFADRQFLYVNLGTPGQWWVCDRWRCTLAKGIGFSSLAEFARKGGAGTHEE